MKKYSFFFKQIKYDFLIFLREPFFALPILIMPAVFFTIYAGLYAKSGAVTSFGPYVPMYALLISFLTIFFNIGIQVVNDKETGVFKRLVISPANLYFLVATYVVRGVIISFVGLIEIICCAVFVYGIPLTSNIVPFVLTYLVLIGILLLFSLSLHGFFKNTKQVVPFTIIMFQYVLFASGMIVPVNQLPKFLRVFVYVNPMYHMNKTAIAVWNNNMVQSSSLFALAAVVIICSALVLKQRRAEV